MSSDDIAIRVRNLSKCYNMYGTPRDRLKQFVLPRLQRLSGCAPKRYFSEFWALQDVGFEVRKGETVGIIGRNGSGKSTLLQLIAGTMAPTQGSVEVNGKVAALLELGTGFNPEFTGRENVILNALILGLVREEVADRFDEIAAFAGIGDFIEQPVKTYSSGMLLRLAFAVSVCVKPDILIIDEALAVGDEKFQRKCFARLEALKGRGTSILFVSHSSRQVVELCERALLLENGRRILFAAPAPVVRSYERLIYASTAEQLTLVKTLHAADAAGAFDESVSMAPAAGQALPTAQAEIDTDLVPELTTAYPARGAEIQRIQLQDVDGEAVNLVRASARYRFVMEGCLQADVDDINFALHIRSISGAVVAGQRYPEEGTSVKNLRAGSKFRIDFWFNMRLLPGTYFAGGGLWSATRSNYVHRILDAIMFRVEIDGPHNAFGYCDLIAAPADFRLS